jgi:hypothetical protein
MVSPIFQASAAYRLNPVLPVDAANVEQEFVDSARMWEKSRNYPLAIEAYLSVTRAHDSDPDRLNEIWQHALRLASEHEKHAKYVELADDVAHRFVELAGLRFLHGRDAAVALVCFGTVRLRCGPSVSCALLCDGDARLLEVGNYVAAGELFREIQQFKPAIDAFMKAEAWDRARDVARTAAPQYK